MKKILIIIIILISLTGCTKETEEKKITIVTTNFPCYDFVRAIVKDTDVDIKLLIKPGTQIHDFDPTPKDIMDIENSDMFVYIGGESDDWVNNILKTNRINNIVKLMDLVSTIEEETVEGMEIEDEEEIEYDEHIWTNPVNVIKIINTLKEEIINIDQNNKEIYEKNANNYIKELKNIDSEIRNIVDASKRKELIFGDRFPFVYFTKEYGLKYYAAFPGCSDETEASAKTLSYLINKVKEDNIPFILKIELSNSKIADTIASETNTKVLEFNSAHNISEKDFKRGKTYVDIMNENIKVLRQVLN